MHNEILNFAQKFSNTSAKSTKLEQRTNHQKKKKKKNSKENLHSGGLKILSEKSDSGVSDLWCKNMNFFRFWVLGF